MSGVYDLYEGKKKVSQMPVNAFQIQSDDDMFKKNILLRLELLEAK